MTLRISLARQLRVMASPFGLALLLGLFLPIACLLWFMFSAAEADRIATEKRLKEVMTNDIEHAVRLWKADIFHLTGIEGESISLNELFEIGASQANASVVMVTSENGDIKFPDLNGSHQPFPPEFRHALEQARKYSGAGVELKAIDVLIALQKSQSYRQGSAAHQLAIDYTLWKQLVGTNADRGTADNKELLAIEDRLFAKLNSYDEADIDPRLRLLYMKKVQALLIKTPALKNQTVLDQTVRFYERVSSAGIGENIQKYLSRQIEDAYVARSYDLTGSSVVTLDEPVVLWLLRDARALEKSLESVIDARLGDDVARVEISRSSPVDPALVAYYHQLDTTPIQHVKVYWQSRGVFDRSISRQSLIYFFVGISVVIFLCASAAYVFYHMRREKELSQLKSDAISTIAHELKTPLTSIRLLLDNLTQNASDPQQIKEYAQIMSREHARLSNLVDKFLTFNRLDRKHAKLNLTLTDINHLVMEVLQVLADKIERQEVKIHFDKGVF